MPPRRVQEVRVEGGGGRSAAAVAVAVATAIVGRGLRDDVLDDVSPGIDVGGGGRADDAALVVVEVLRISHHPVDGLVGRAGGRRRDE